MSGVTRGLGLSDVSKREHLDTRVRSFAVGGVDGKEDDPRDDHTVIEENKVR